LKPIRLKGEKLMNLYREVYKRDNGLCVKCGTFVEPGTIPHHIIFRSQGGSDTLDNLQTLCLVCHGWAHGRR